jgi:hypothetical protein
MNEIELNKLIDDRLKVMLPQYLKGNAFSTLKVTDTPTEALQVVPRKFVTNNGTVANRPVSSVAVIGQPYYATDTFIPMTYSVEGWRNGSGSVVALNN